jgi:hypothetical protein
VAPLLYTRRAASHCAAAGGRRSPALAAGDTVEASISRRPRGRAGVRARSPSVLGNGCCELIAHQLDGQLSTAEALQCGVGSYLV